MFQLKLLSDVHGEMSNGNYNAHDKKVQCLAVKKQLFAETAYTSTWFID